MSITVFGIRHHGPGSARSLKKALEKLQPNIILVEGPPDANSIINLAAHEEMKPPVALLAYMPDKPEEAVFYPFATFSPEWQAIKFARQTQIPVQFMDLPLAHKFALDEDKPENDHNSLPANLDEPGNYPLDYLGRAAGFADGELWWEHMFEQRRNSAEAFEAVLEAMQHLRQELARPESAETLLREAYMRKIIRQAETDGYQNIAVVCGAWHAPALVQMPPKKQDNDLLKGLPKVKVAATWIPWTFNRLTFYSGYGAGVTSPGWYQHLWDFPEDLGIGWMTKVARVFRKKNMDTSVAHVIDAFRLSETLAGLRQLSRPGLAELNQATQSVICFGDDLMLQLIFQELIVGKKIGRVPEDAPQVPLQKDLERLQKKLRLTPKAFEQQLTLDLRQPNDLERSKLLHRLALLGINWGRSQNASGKGTFKEQWLLNWEPELLIKVIEMGIWGNTLERAASNYIVQKAKETTIISEVAELLEKAIPADLEAAVAQLMQRIDALASVSGDISQLMRALIPLAYVSRYGNVRQTDLNLLTSLVQGLTIRVSIGLPNACYGLDEDASSEMFEVISEVQSALSLFQEPTILEPWRQTLRTLLVTPNIHGLIVGRACRLLADSKEINEQELGVKFSLALSSAQEPGYSAAWLEGFLRGSGMILLLDEVLWNILNNWVSALDEETFVQILPLLRRNFASFTPAERRKIGEKAKSNGSLTKTATQINTADFNYERAEKALPIIAQLLGLEV
ncbi:MAG: DUF5682 family protein [Adhaeribacter sp.]